MFLNSSHLKKRVSGRFVMGLGWYANHTGLVNKSFTQTKQCKWLVQMSLTWVMDFVTLVVEMCASPITLSCIASFFVPQLWAWTPSLRPRQQYTIIEKIIFTHVNTNLTMIGLHVFSQIFYSIYTLWQIHSHHPHFQMMVGFWTLWICKHWRV